MQMESGKRLCLSLLLLTAAQPLLAHTINYSLQGAPAQNVVGFYVKLGIEHIVPHGLDHILFVVGLCLLNTSFKSILWQATAFTVAHSITLVLSMQGAVAVPAEIVEPIIALSILFIAVENILLSRLRPWRIGVVFLFGLIHGLGFAGALNEVGLPPDRFFLSLLSFNLGVELGQIIVIALVFAAVIFPFGKTPLYRKAFVYPLSAVIALVALWWTIERL